MSESKKQIPPRPLTRKQRAFIRHMVTHPKDSATQAVRATYDIKNPEGSTARTIAAENLAKPSIRAELDKHLGTAEMTMLEVMELSKEYAKTGTREGASYAGVAVQASKDIQDRVKGKPVQRTEVTGKVVTLNVDLTGVVQPEGG